MGFYLDHILCIAAGVNTLVLLVQDGENSRPKKKKKLMKKKTKRRGEGIIYSGFWTTSVLTGTFFSS